MAGEYAVKITVRNGLILRRMKELGIASQTELARLAGISLSSTNGLVTLRRAPRSRLTGEWIDDAFALSSALQVEPEELWTETQSRMALKKSTYEKEVSEDEIRRLTAQANPERYVLDNQLKDKVHKVLHTLPERYAHVLRRRFFDDAILEDIGAEIGTQRERVRQIEAKALRKLKHPSNKLEGIREEYDDD
jgi:DNA-directed RNA polymerase sigma subunit (sigma70/sigma32)